ncbi:unnamed protein product (macronuclear) [Paramecium tetraurelia]|uniref:Uncharacterized protein n=1 Tax=Paramecium tetraurelia TaxID=5888 RepID=A0DX18_PARTE|nr:uncharacterized protein GSPATT00021217001 [Paramecium tetraurelia]CAK87585.1 unnamed protein product [Paramecium tetraurelia]|eukprot:XP_001454982.1 hypothetical protein (macronuclear) [Paramecium tetraurelia strain d4-2]
MAQSSIRQKYQTLPIQQTSQEEYSKSSTKDSDYFLKQLTVPLKIKLNAYKPIAKNLFSKSLYKQQYTDCKSERVRPIIQDQNMYILNTLELDDESVYRRSYRSRTFDEKTEPIKPFNVNISCTLPMRGAKSVYQCNFTQKEVSDQPNKIIKPQSKRMVYSIWDKSMKTQYQHHHTGEKGELTLKITPKQNQLFIMNYEKTPESQYRYDYRRRVVGYSGQMNSNKV